MELSIEDINKINTEIAHDIQESCTMRWWKILLQLGVMMTLLVSYFGMIWYVSLFTKEILPYLIVIAVWFVILLWYIFLGYDYIEMKIYFWKKSKLKQ